jgi:hypothetical protein
LKTRNVQSLSFNTTQHPLLLGQNLVSSALNPNTLAAGHQSPQQQQQQQLLLPTQHLSADNQTLLQKPISPTISNLNLSNQNDT